jgi:hypothetical protein
LLPECRIAAGDAIDTIDADVSLVVAPVAWHHGHR